MVNRTEMQAGVTLIELLITLIILAVIISFAVPATGSLVELQHSRTVTQQLYRAVQFTRAEAIKRGENVVLCPLDRITKRCTSDWNQELIVFHDTQGDGTLDSIDQILLSVPSVPAGKLLARPTSLKSLRFNGLGYSPGTMGNLTYCPREANTSPNAVRQLIFTMNGRIRWAQDNDGDGVPESTNGSPVSCAEATSSN